MNDSQPDSALGRMMAGVLNRAINLDPDSKKPLRRLEGRSLGVELIGPNLRVVLQVEEGQFVVSLDDAIEPSTWIKASPGAFLALAATQGQTGAGTMEIIGDVETGRRFQELFENLNPDFEEAFTRVFGDVVGVQVARLIKGGLGWARQRGQRWTEDVGVYLRDESQQLVNRFEMEHFLDAVDDLRDDAARLAKRIERLTA